MSDKISATNFCGTLTANVDNEKMSDAEFREFVRNTLGIVESKSRAYNDGIQICLTGINELQAQVEQVFRDKIRDLRLKRKL
jgi:hypothetical protein